MPQFKCYPYEDERALWMYCPSYAAAISFCVLFGLTTLAHIGQGFLFRKPFTIVLIMGALWETGGYAFRILSVRDQLNEGFMTGQILLIVLAPLWINAFVYMLLGRMIHFYLATDQVFGIRARRVTLMFVGFDIIAFLIQCAGAMMLNSSMPVKTQKVGMNVYMSGVGAQILFILVFFALAIQFSRLVKKEDFFSAIHTDNSTTTRQLKTSHQALRLLYVIYTVLLLIIYRNIYRLIEFSAGIESSITKQEWYTFVFDSVPMLLCLLILNVFHPGFVLRGPRCDFSEENREKKRLKREKKEKKKAAKRERKELKKSEKMMQRMEKKQEKKATKMGGKPNEV